MNTLVKFNEIFASALAVPAEQITDELEYQGIPEWDSMSHMILITELESAYAITIETQDMLDMTSVPKVKEILTKYNISING